jgi:hypothetical protein
VVVVVVVVVVGPARARACSRQVLVHRSKVEAIGTSGERPVVKTARDILDDHHAVAILDLICAVVATTDAETAAGDGDKAGALVAAALPRDLRFTHDRNGIWAGSDFALFLCMLLVNRAGLVNLFFRREVRGTPRQSVSAPAPAVRGAQWSFASTMRAILCMVRILYLARIDYS